MIHNFVGRSPRKPHQHAVAHLRSLGGDAGGPSHYIPAYLGISRHISDPFFCSRASLAPTPEVAQLRERRGEQLVGYKIGCVCSENQERNKLFHPVYGRLWSTEQYSNDVDLATRDFANIAIEGEFAVTLRDDVELGNASIRTVAAKVDEVFTVIELHNLVLRSDERGPELIANNAIHAGVVRSTGVRPPQTSARTELSVECDGHNGGHWSNRRWPDDLLQEVPWLVTELAKEGIHLERGQMILTGAWGPPLPLAGREGSERVEVVSTLFGSVAASFSG